MEVEAAPEVGRTGATGAGGEVVDVNGVVERTDDGEEVIVEMAEDISVWVDVNTMVEAAAAEVLLDGKGAAVTIGVTITVAVECTSHPTPLQL